MADILLSVLIPSRNRAFYLKHAIQSAINIQCNNIEIIVSENHGADNGLEIAKSFEDFRLHVLRPEKPLPMHENFEFLLSLAKGRWITFLGDDDAVMPHCVEYLEYLDKTFPNAEAICSPRAYYRWPHACKQNDSSECRFAFEHREVWRDSKKQLLACMNGKLEYLELPQLYSGGFHRRSLVSRVIRMQGGHYFRSVTPDAYSAVMACLHTYRYLEVGVPMTWVGTSSPSNWGGPIKSTKDKEKDFFGMHSQDSIAMNPCLGKEYSRWPFILHFFEAYIAASPFVCSYDLSVSRIRKVYAIAARQMVLRGDIQGSIDLARSLGITPLRPLYVIVHAFLARVFDKTMQIFGRIFANAFRGIVYADGANPFSDKRYRPFFVYRSLGPECSDILASDNIIREAFREYKSKYLRSQL
jgi:glycosyltransferase involved in cell wall biosynthesis